MVKKWPKPTRPVHIYVYIYVCLCASCDRLSSLQRNDHRERNFFSDHGSGGRRLGETLGVGNLCELPEGSSRDRKAVIPERRGLASTKDETFRRSRGKSALAGENSLSRDHRQQSFLLPRPNRMRNWRFGARGPAPGESKRKDMANTESKRKREKVENGRERGSGNSPKRYR